MPKSNVLKFFLEESSWIAIRLSGIELKLKFYIATKAKREDNVNTKINGIRDYLNTLIQQLV